MTRFDVAIIGGGIAGTSAGYFLGRAGASVVVLERERTLGMHSTGRSASVFTECYGVPTVRRLALSSRGFLEDPPRGFASTPLLSHRSILFAASHDQAPRLDAEAAAQQALVPAVRRVSSDEAVGMCPVLDGSVIAGAILEPDAKDLDVDALYQGYQRGIREDGGEIRPGFGVIALDRSGGGWRVRSADDTVMAEVIVVAAGAWCDEVAALSGATPLGLVPKRRTAFTFAPPPGADVRSWPMVVDLDEHWYFKPEGSSVLASPADADPVEPHDVRHREQDVALGIQRIQEVTTMSIASVRSAWAGLRSFLPDGAPVNGFDDRVPGLYWLAGQGGFGIKSSPAMGRYASQSISDGGPGADLRSAGLSEATLGVGRLRG